MITPELLQKCPIHRKPYGQVLWSKVLRLNYFLMNTTVQVEGLENLPMDRPVCLAMNHTDRYNSWPLQLYLLQHSNQFVVTWVKGKYYENPITRFFLLSTSNIPLASRGYVLSTQFKQSASRSPTSEEYRFIRDLLDEKLEISEETLLQATPACRQFLSPSPVQRLQNIEKSFDNLSLEVVRLNQEALSIGHHILVFPEGTRSVKLSKGHIGIAQMSQRLGIDIVPIGCNGSDKCYPGNNPLAQKGTITYRIGKPLHIDGEELGSYRIKDNFIPFGRKAEQDYGQRFRKITDIVMERINVLLDKEYQYSNDGQV